MLRVLIVDDAAFLRKVLREIIERNGYEVIGEAVNGREAVYMYNKLRPDIVTMDITMPEMDGLAAVKAIQAIDPRARILMCSAMGQTGMVIEAMKSGARDFIVKPFMEERVIEALKKVS